MRASARRDEIPLYIYFLNVGQGCISLTTIGSRAREKILSVVSVLRVIFFNFCTLLRKCYARTVLSCVYFKIFYFELLDPEILSGLHNFLNIHQQDFICVLVPFELFPRDIAVQSGVCVLYIKAVLFVPADI